jgi:hypothetical protein
LQRHPAKRCPAQLVSAQRRPAKRRQAKAIEDNNIFLEFKFGKIPGAAVTISVSAAAQFSSAQLLSFERED